MGDTAIYQCPSCGSHSWTTYEIKDGLCPFCQDRLDEDDYYEDEEVINCPKCGREYRDEASQDFGICDYCHWNSMEGKYV